MSYELTGTVFKICPPQTFASGFTKRELIVEVHDGKEGKYNQLIPVEFIKDKVGELDKLRIGMEVEISINLRGREWQDRYFLSAQAWRLKVMAGGTQQAAASNEIPPKFDDYEDDIPF
ncbi:MAG: DUF3127 domain-containing protein [Pontiellaceae bacterium]|nr:DUF3127 domain-containing protein [Pontiellaceae bacterium]